MHAAVFHVFSKCPSAAIMDLARRASRRLVRVGEDLFTEGEEAVELLFLLKGELSLTKVRSDGLVPTLTTPHVEEDSR